MPPSGTPAVPEGLLDEAIEWLERVRGPASTPAEQANFEAWLASSAAHRAAYEEAARRLRRLEQLGRNAQDLRREARDYRPAPRVSARARLGLAAGAAALVMAAGLIAIVPRDWFGTAAQYTSSRGDRRAVTLADGTRMELNIDTVLRVRYSPWRRSVMLERGEAYFSVAHERFRPFEVQAGSGRMTDIGTEFDVYRRANSVLVAVQSGSVSVQARGARTLAAGHALAYDDTGEFLPQAPPANQLSAWRQGRIVFDNRPLAEVLAEVARYRQAPIELADPALGRRRISGTLYLDHLDGGLAALADVMGIRLTRERDGTLTVSPP